LTRPSHDAVAFHAGDLRANGAPRDAQLRGDVVRRQRTASQERDDPPATGIKELLF
jgi:hypothetical protein